MCSTFLGGHLQSKKIHTCTHTYTYTGPPEYIYIHIYIFLWCQINAGNPSELNQTYPDIYARAYGDAVPDPPMFDEEMIRSIKAAIPARKTHQSLQTRSLPRPTGFRAIEGICNLPGFQLLSPRVRQPSQIQTSAQPALTPSAEALLASPGVLALIDASGSQAGTRALALQPSAPPHYETEGSVTQPLQPSVSPHGQTAAGDVNALAENLGIELTSLHPIWQLLPNTFAPKLCEALSPIIFGQKN